MMKERVANTPLGGWRSAIEFLWKRRAGLVWFAAAGLLGLVCRTSVVWWDPEESMGRGFARGAGGKTTVQGSSRNRDCGVNRLGFLGRSSCGADQGKVRPKAQRHGRKERSRSRQGPGRKGVRVPSPGGQLVGDLRAACGQARPLSDWQMGAALDKETHVSTAPTTAPLLGLVCFGGGWPNWLSLFRLLALSPAAAGRAMSPYFVFCTLD